MKAALGHCRLTSSGNLDTYYTDRETATADSEKQGSSKKQGFRTVQNIRRPRLTGLMASGGYSIDSKILGLGGAAELLSVTPFSEEAVEEGAPISARMRTIFLRRTP